MNIKFYIVFILLSFFKADAQNYISNPSFSEVYPKIDSTLFYQISQAKSDVKNWYIPKYINFDPITEAGTYRLISYFSSRDKIIIPRDGKQHDEIMTLGDQLFENNLGFVRMNSSSLDPPPLIQQKFLSPIKEGEYCLKFKYKYLSYSATRKRPPSLDFVISPSDLKEYYTDYAVNVPKKYIKVSFRDSVDNTDENTPWQQQCYKIELNGDENFLSIGCLRNIDSGRYGIFFIDDIELYRLINLEDSCRAEKVDKDLRTLYRKDFALNTKLESDTMIMYVPPFNIGSDIISPEAKFYLSNIIAFMQRNPLVKINFIEYNNYKNKNPGHYQYFKRYLNFFGIDNNRITAKSNLCKDPRPAYCGRSRIFIKIGFMFYE